MSLNLDSTIDAKEFYNKFVHNYALTHKNVCFYVSEESKTISVRMDILALISGFKLAVKREKKYKKTLVKENNKLVVKNILYEDEGILEKQFEPLFDYRKEHMVGDYLVTFELCNGIGFENHLFINIPLPSKKEFEFFKPNKIVLKSEYTYSISISFNGDICSL